MSHITIGRWGRNLAVRLPGEIVRQIGLHDGEQLDIEVLDHEIRLRRPVPPPDLDVLFRGQSAAAWRAAYADAFDWGADLGREIVAE